MLLPGKVLSATRTHQQDPGKPVKAETALRTARIPCKEKSGRTVKTISLAWGKTSRWRRKVSRTIRLMRFLRTAFPTFLGTLIPNRRRAPKPVKKMRAKPLPRNLVPYRYTVLNSPVFLIIQVLGSLNCFTCSGRKPLTTSGTPALYDSLTCACFHAGTESVGTFTFNITGLKSSFTHVVIL